jgi:hypothetical protein
MIYCSSESQVALVTVSLADDLSNGNMSVPPIYLSVAASRESSRSLRPIPLPSLIPSNRISIPKVTVCSPLEFRNSLQLSLVPAQRESSLSSLNLCLRMRWSLMWDVGDVGDAEVAREVAEGA